MKLRHYSWFGRGRSLRLAITMACQMAFILYGYDQGVFSGIVGNEDFLNTFGHPDSALEGIIVSIYNLGCFSGCILSFFFAESTGRRLAMWIAMGFIIVSSAPSEPSTPVDHLTLLCLDWCCSTDFSLQCAAYHNCPFRHGYWHWNRDLYRANVPI